MSEIKLNTAAQADSVGKIQASAKIDLTGGKGLDSLDDILTKTMHNPKDTPQESPDQSRNLELDPTDLKKNHTAESFPEQ